MPGASAPPELRLPRPEPVPARAWVASVVLHGAALVLLAILFVPPAERPDALPLAALRPPARPRIVGYLVLAPAPVSVPTSIPPAPPAPIAEPRAGSPAAAAGSPPDSVAVVVNGRASVSAPALATGVLWDRRAPPPAYMNRSHAELTDSAVKAMIQHYWDSLAKLPGGGQLLLPTWKATIAGQEFGLDQQWVTVAGVKVPAILLGLIPIGVAGNQSEALDKVGQGREDDYQRSRAAQEAAADQREQIKAIRERNAAEQELRRRQQAPP